MKFIKIQVEFVSIDLIFLKKSMVFQKDFGAGY